MPSCDNNLRNESGDIFFDKRTDNSQQRLPAAWRWEACTVVRRRLPVPSDHRGHPGSFSGCLCVCARAHACVQACVFVHERARANTQPRTDQDPLFRRQVYNKQKGGNDLKIYTARGTRHQWSCVRSCACARACACACACACVCVTRTRTCACVRACGNRSEKQCKCRTNAQRAWYGWMDARLYERPCLSLALQALQRQYFPALHATVLRHVDVTCDQSLSDWYVG